LSPTEAQLSLASAAGNIPRDCDGADELDSQEINDLYDGRAEADPAVTFAELEQAGVKFKAISTNLARIARTSFRVSPKDFIWS